MTTDSRRAPNRLAIFSVGAVGRIESHGVEFVRGVSASFTPGQHLVDSLKPTYSPTIGWVLSSPRLAVVVLSRCGLIGVWRLSAGFWRSFRSENWNEQSVVRCHFEW